MVSVKTLSLGFFTDFLVTLSVLFFWVVQYERSWGFTVVDASHVWLAPLWAQAGAEDIHPGSHFHAHFFVALLTLLWSSKKADEKLAVQRTAPCPLPWSVFMVDGTPGVQSLGGHCRSCSCSAAQHPSLSDQTLVFSSADCFSFKEAFACSFHETCRTIHLYFSSTLGWVVSLASLSQSILAEYRHCQCWPLYQRLETLFTLLSLQFFYSTSLKKK